MDGLENQVMQAHDSTGNVVVLDQLLELFLTVGARRNADLCPGLTQLLRLGLAGDTHAEFVDLIQRHQTSSAAATVVVAAHGLHVYKVLYKRTQNLSWLLDDPTGASYIARIVVGHPLGDDVGIKNDFALAKAIQRVLHEIHYRISFFPAEDGHEIVRGTGGMAALADQDGFAIEARHLSHKLLDNSLE